MANWVFPLCLAERSADRNPHFEMATLLYAHLKNRIGWVPPALGDQRLGLSGAGWLTICHFRQGLNTDRCSPRSYHSKTRNFEHLEASKHPTCYRRYGCHSHFFCLQRSSGPDHHIELSLFRLLRSVLIWSQGALRQKQSVYSGDVPFRNLKVGKYDRQLHNMVAHYERKVCSRHIELEYNTVCKPQFARSID